MWNKRTLWRGGRASPPDHLHHHHAFQQQFRVLLCLLILSVSPCFCLSISTSTNNSNGNNGTEVSSSSSSSSSGGGVGAGPPPPPGKKGSLIGPPPVVQLLVQQQDPSSNPDCKDFEDNNSNEFFSPLYLKEQNYPDNINCFKVISAGVGEVIRIRFLDKFHLEQDDAGCNYDFLEIRDGRYGYSSLIEKLCGSTPPPYVESSGRHLWLRFHSDEDIGHVGFRAMFEFVPSLLARPDLDDCTFHMTSLEGFISSDNMTEEIRENRRDLSVPHVDCTWMIEAPENQKIYLQFDEFKLENANDCQYNFIEVYGSRTELEGAGDEGRKAQFCSSDTKAITSSSNILHLRFFSALKIKDSETPPSFETKLSVYYSFFRDISPKSKKDPKEASDPKDLVKDEYLNKCKEPEEFDCTDNSCIDRRLVCNTKISCKLGNDEDKGLCIGQKAAFEMTMDLIVIAFIGCFLATGMCSGLILNICRKLRQDKIELEEIRASMRKSRESMPPSASSKLAVNTSRDDLKSIEIPELSSSSTKNSTQNLKVLPPNNPTPNKLNNSLSASPPPPPPAASSPENSSGESKETVIYRPYFSKQEQQAAATPTMIPMVAHHATSPEPHLGFVVKHPPTSSIVPQTSTSSIPYSPPPPYNPSLKYKQTPKLSRKANAGVGDSSNNEVEEERTATPEEVHVIEVRDCACQTKESFTERYLREVYFGPHHHHYYPPRASTQSPSQQHSGGAAANKRAPLARTEAVEMFDLPTRRHVRRVPKASADILMFPKSPSSITSSVDASTGSLELLSELDEDEDETPQQQQQPNIARRTSNNTPKSGYRELE